MTLLVLGAGGQIGRAIVERAAAGVRGFDKSACNICDADAVARAMSIEGLSAVVNCAAYTAVEQAESDREHAFAVNERGAATVARLSADRHLPLIHLSTDYVYDGARNGRHVEEEPLAPCNVYGEAKAAGDRAVAALNPDYIVLRASWVFGVYGANFVKTMLRLGKMKPALSVVDDQRGGPTEARDIADAILTMWRLSRESGFRSWGVYNFAGEPPTTWCGFAREIFDRAGGPSPGILPVRSDEFPTKAVRPLNSVLDCSKIRRVFGIGQPDWRQSLARVLTSLDESRPRDVR